LKDHRETTMGCCNCNELATALDAIALDPTQHVNFAKGMVLGVDDFRQEFAYLSGRDQWLARDAIGYGTLSGLRVYVDDAGADGPRLHVSAGSALVPSGKHVCVGADQCAVINKWLAKPEGAATVARLLGVASPPASPPLSPAGATGGTISLFLTLCYDDCTTRPVPVPGEPCRSDDELMADSRVADDFRLELRAAAPAQVEEDSLRDFVRWLHANVQVVAASPPSAGDEAAWLAALRPAAQAWLDAAAMSPPMSPPASFSTLGDYLVDLSPLNLVIAPGQVCEFLRTAFRFWVTELRPLWMARRCHLPMVKDQDCVLLARLELEVEFVGGSPTGAWVVTGSPATIRVDESARPFLVHLRMLQEWAMCGCECTGLGAAAASMGGPGPSTPILAPRPPAAPAVRGGRVPVMKTSTPLTLDDSHYCVVCAGASGLKITLAASIPATAGRMHVIKNVDVGALTVVADAVAGDRIDDKPTVTIKKRHAVTLIADGEGAWQVIGTAE
jgi:hypothetical protein